jgi:sigma-E factor negative regulatory protein RseB
VTRWSVPGGRTGLVLAVAMLATCALVQSSDAAGPGTVPGTDPQAQALLQRAVDAESATTYQGVEFMSVDPDTGSLLPGASNSGEITVLDVTHLPGQGTVLVEDAEDGTPGQAGFAAATSGADTTRPNLLLGLLGRSYRLQLDQDGLVAGRPARQVVARRADGSVAARFWVDAATGLLLRRDVIAADGLLVRRSEFVQIALTAAPLGHLPVMLPPPSGRPLSDSALDRWSGDGWPCPRVLAGLSLFDARSETGASGPVLHLTYSDGLSTVSVFVQPGRLDPSGLAGSAATVGGEPVWVRPGMPDEVLWSSGGHVITVVADAPADVVDAVVSSLPHLADDPGGWARVERGFARMVSWLNPFG